MVENGEKTIEVGIDELAMSGFDGANNLTINEIWRCFSLGHKIHGTKKTNVIY